MRIEEEDEVDFVSYDELSYKDNDSEDVELYCNDEYIGDIKVWLDSDMDNREYLCINYTVVYLDTLKKR
jgi:hypothetical protein